MGGLYNYWNVSKGDVAEVEEHSCPLALLLHLELFCPQMKKSRLFCWLTRGHLEQLSQLPTEALVSSGKTRRERSPKLLAHSHRLKAWLF